MSEKLSFENKIPEPEPFPESEQLEDCFIKHFSVNGVDYWCSLSRESCEDKNIHVYSLSFGTNNYGVGITNYGLVNFNEAVEQIVQWIREISLQHAVDVVTFSGAPSALTSNDSQEIEVVRGNIQDAIENNPEKLDGISIVCDQGSLTVNSGVITYTSTDGNIVEAKVIDAENIQDKIPTEISEKLKIELLKRFGLNNQVLSSLQNDNERQKKSMQRTLLYKRVLDRLKVPYDESLTGELVVYLNAEKEGVVGKNKQLL